MRILACLLLSVLLATTAMANYSGPSAGAQHQTGDVSKALNARDDTRMILEGRVTKHLGGDKYTFQDRTGSMVVEIDRKAMQGIKFDDKTRVRLYGEVDSEKQRKNEFDVSRVEIVR